MIDKANFFKAIRKDPFGGRLNQGQVGGMEAIIEEWEKRPTLIDLRWLAYMLATTFHETAATMQPIAERGGKAYFNKYDAGTPIGRRLGNTAKGDGYFYRGRGFVQLTGRANYQRMGELLRLNLLGDPDLALVPVPASRIMFEGMLRAESFRGDFTGKSLEDYFNDTKTDWVNARRIINGLDKADKIAGYGKLFFAALYAASP